MDCSTGRLLCPSLFPGVCSHSCALSWSCCLTISSSAACFFCFQAFPASGSFPVGQLFKSGGQSIGVSASALVLPMDIQDWFPLRWTGWISLQYKDSQESSPTPQFKSINSSALSLLYSPALTSYMTTGKTIALTRWTFVNKVMSRLSNTLSRLDINFLPRSKRLLI